MATYTESAPVNFHTMRTVGGVVGGGTNDASGAGGMPHELTTYAEKLTATGPAGAVVATTVFLVVGVDGRVVGVAGRVVAVGEVVNVGLCVDAAALTSDVDVGSTVDDVVTDESSAPC